MIWREVRLRSSQSFRLMMQVPAFDPRPSVSTSYPASDVTVVTPSTDLQTSSSSRDLALVYSSVEPAGVWMMP